jgi:hypothetical protein
VFVDVKNRFAAEQVKIAKDFDVRNWRINLADGSLLGRS